MTERELMACVKDAATKLGWRFYHQRFSLGSDTGWPDCFMVRGDRALAAELKGPNGKATTAQLETLLALDGAGIETALWRPEHWESGEIAEALR